MNRHSKSPRQARSEITGEPPRSSQRHKFRGLAVAVIGAATLLASVPAIAQSHFGQSCQRSDAATMPFEQADASYEGTSAQQLMNGIAKEMARPPAQVIGAYVFKDHDRVLVLWMRGQFVCNSGPFERALFDRVVRMVFGVDI